MDDKSRCLEQLALKVQRLTFVEVQNKFLLGDVESGSDLLSYWEHYTDLSKTEVKHDTKETFSSTIKRYSNRLGALQKVLDSLPKHSCVEDLQKQLKDLEKKFTSTKLGIGGGTFEWVDSILVKCLKDGAWLVIDNVNLCSPAVLDRLNGLLEPGGELVVGERGVGQDGELVSVKPHPNFRLFLLMDPHHGEISRAMRNRGVELCLLSLEERPFGPNDFRAILKHIGISRDNQQALLTIHREMANLAIGYESLTTNHLLQVASLTTQHAVRGRPFLASLSSACSDVYIQSRHLSSEQKERVNRMLTEIIETYKRELISSEENISDPPGGFDTLDTLSLQENSALALLQQKCALFMTNIQLTEEKYQTILQERLKDAFKALMKRHPMMNDSFNAETFNVTQSEVIQQIFLTLMCSVSENDLSLRQSFISNIISSCQHDKMKKDLTKLEACLIAGVQKVIESDRLNRLDQVKRKNLCWDLRRVSPWLVDLDSCDFENKAIAYLYYLKQSLEIEVIQGKTKTPTVKNMTVLEFSTAYSKGKVTVAGVKSDLVLGLSQFLAALDAQMLLVLDSAANLDCDQCCQLILASQWVLRLHRLADLKLFESEARGMRVCDEVVTLLTLHIGWTKKWLFPQLTRLLVKHSKRQESGKLPPELTELCRDIALVSPVRSLGKKMRARTGQPLPLNTDLQAQVLETVARLEAMVDLKNVDLPTKLIQRRVEFILSDKGRNELRRFTELCSKALNPSSDLLPVLEELKELETKLVDENLSSIVPQDETSTQVSKDSGSWEVPLWAVKGVFCLRMMSAVLSTPTYQLISSLSAGIKGVPLVSPRLPAVLDNSDKHQLLALNLLMDQLSRSPVLTSARFWLTFSSLYQTNDVETEGLNKYYLDDRQRGEHEVLPLNCSLLAVFTTTLLYPQIHESCDLSLRSPTLRNHRQHSALLQALLETIWNNGPALGSLNFNYRTNERTCLSDSYDDFLTIFKQTVRARLEKKELSPNDKNFFTTINDLLDKKTDIEHITGFSSVVKELLSDVVRHFEVLNTTVTKVTSSENESLLDVGEGWTHLGLVQLKLFSHMAQVDPVRINDLKLQYCVQEQADLELSLAYEGAQGDILGSYHFPLAEAFIKRLEVLKAKEQTLKKLVAKRPEPNVYSNIYNEIQQLMGVVVHAGRRVETVATLLASIVAMTRPKQGEGLTQAAVTTRGKQIDEAVTQAKSLLTSLLMSRDSLDKKYGTWYPDVTLPILSALTKLTHGLSLMIGAANSARVNLGAPVEKLLWPLATFPQPDCSSAFRLAEVCTSTELLELLKSTVKSKLKPGITFPDQTFRLAKCSLQDLSNVINVQGEIRGDEKRSIVRGILDHLVRAWRLQEETRVEKEQQEASIFINKTRKVENLTEEQEDAIEMRKLFPSYREKDFADLEPPSLEHDHVMKDISDTESDPGFKLSEENIVEIHRIYSEMVTRNTKSHWMKPDDSVLLNFTIPLSDRFAIFSVLLDSLYEGCSYELDSVLIPALCLTVRMAHLRGTSGSVECENTRKHYDFYHDSNIAESKLCVPILESLTKRVLELLDEWPDHPTLNQILLVINRILDFPSRSPLSRFLVGLELLLTKLKEWEENAHSGVTLAPHAAAVTRQILDWRKEELAQWKGCFESARIRLCDRVVSKWWFHLYSLVHDNSENSAELSTVLEQFMESSSLGEYQARLNLLYVFHCHAVNGLQELQSNILWNIHQYYSQFSQVVSRRIKELSQPVEKKLKDFVKIARWNDINYWAVKETVDKTHRTLFKYMREYESILKEPARNAMTKLDPIGRQLFELSIDAKSYVAPLNLLEMLSETTEGDSLLGRGRVLFSKARKLCRESIDSCSLPQDIEALQSVIEELKEVSELLAIEDVDRTLSKEKQKSAAKSVLHRKRKALSDLFHLLSGLGLSYRAGLIKTGGEQFTTHAPLNVKAGLEQIDSKPCDKDLLRAWGGCDQFFLHSVAFTAQLHSALTKPHKDLGPAIIERCKGFTNHLMYFCHQQKKCVTESVTSLYNLRCLTQCLASLQPLGVDSSSILQLKTELISTLEDVVFSLSQFEILMDCCPASPDVVAVEEATNTNMFETSEVTITHGDEHFTKIRSLLTSAINSAKKYKETLKGTGKFSEFLTIMYRHHESTCFETEFETLVSLDELKVLKDGHECLSKIESDVKEIMNKFRMKNANDVNLLSLSLLSLRSTIRCTQENFNKKTATIERLTTPTENHILNQVVNDEERKSVETFLSKILFSIQEFYKTFAPKEPQASENPNDQSENLTSKVPNESDLKEQIIGKLQTGVDLLNTKEIIAQLQHVLKRCTEDTNENGSVRYAKMCVPILEQYNLLMQYVITLQISALKTSSHISSQLLALFVDFANKGFQVPEELLEEEGEGAETASGGLGLGEGEGEKDVSDQIESKDQLEDAKKPGEYDKEEDKDCKEEENGIEMTDDFGGNLQDIDKKPDSDGSGEESGDEEEADKEMGETEKGAETLDEQIWGGSDSENEEEESGELKEEEGDRGEQMGDKEMGAKDDNKTPQGEEDDKHGSEDKKDKKKEINEMDEPEVDDDQIDPYHGKHQPQPEPEPLELPDDLQLDDGEGKDQDEDNGEENPFDIDAMKEPKLPEEGESAEDNEELKEKEEGKENEPEEDSSEDEEGDGEGQGENKPEEMEVDETESQQEEDKTADSGGAKDENKTGEEEKMEEGKEEENEEAKPSEDKPAIQAVPKSQQDSGSKDQVDQPEAVEQSNELRPEENAAEGPDQQGVGAAPDKQQQDAQKGSKGESQQAIQSQANELKEEKRQRPGNSEEERALGDVHEPMKKKLKTINMQNENEVAEEEKENGIQEDQTAEMYQHIKEAKESSGDAQTLDAATEEQVAQQKVPNQEDEEANKLEDDQDMTMDQDDPTPETDNVTNVNPEKLKDSADKAEEGAKQVTADGERMEADAGMEVEGELVETMTVTRGGESTFHTRLEALSQELAPSLDVQQVRKQLEQQLASWSQPPPCEEAARAWERLSTVTSDLSRELSEQLRLVLEPTHASRLKGDFRTGRRINMRKVIPYIASQFRKDKIWLRRTKPAKREYQIILAIDDSSSMADNHSKELAFESLAVVSKALNLLEAGQLSVLSFGEQPKILHPLGDTFTEQSGAKLLQQFSFEQQKTQVGALVNFACGVFNRHPGRRGVTDIAQLLVIVSDGRGVMNDGEEVVRQAVRRAKHMNVFMVFVIIDNPQSKDSIMDIRLPKFSGGKLLGIVPYMDSFPFPFYLILRDINSLPTVLSDALRQWFELITASTS